MTRVRAHQRKDGSRVRTHDRQTPQSGERRGVDPDTAAATAAGLAESDAAVHRRADTHRELAAAQEERERPKKGTLSPEMLAEVRRRATDNSRSRDGDPVDDRSDQRQTRPGAGPSLVADDSSVIPRARRVKAAELSDQDTVAVDNDGWLHRIGSVAHDSDSTVTLLTPSGAHLATLLPDESVHIADPAFGGAFAADPGATGIPAGSGRAATVTFDDVSAAGLADAWLAQHDASAEASLSGSLLAKVTFPAGASDREQAAGVAWHLLAAGNRHGFADNTAHIDDWRIAAGNGWQVTFCQTGNSTDTGNAVAGPDGPTTAA